MVTDEKKENNILKSLKAADLNVGRRKRAANFWGGLDKASTNLSNSTVWTGKIGWNLTVFRFWFDGKCYETQTHKNLVKRGSGSDVGHTPPAFNSTCDYNCKVAYFSRD